MVYPSSLKYAIITPIRMIAGLDDSSLSIPGYRAVPNISHLSKFVEKIVKRQQIKHLEKFKLLPMSSQLIAVNRKRKRKRRSSRYSRTSSIRSQMVTLHCSPSEASSVRHIESSCCGVSMLRTASAACFPVSWLLTQRTNLIYPRKSSVYRPSDFGV